MFFCRAKKSSGKNSFYRIFCLYHVLAPVLITENCYRVKIMANDESRIRGAFSSDFSDCGLQPSKR